MANHIPCMSSKFFVAGLVALALAMSTHAQILHPTDPMPSYEVATVKPWDGTGYGIPVRSYILGAFNLPPYIARHLPS